MRMDRGTFSQEAQSCMIRQIIPNDPPHFGILASVDLYFPNEPSL